MKTIARREDGALLVVASNAEGVNPPAEIHLDGGVWRTTVQSALARGTWTPEDGTHSRKETGVSRGA